MKIHNFSDPFTGCDFSAIESEKTLTTTNVFTGEKMQFSITNDSIEIPLACFQKVDMIDPAEACEILNITRQRLGQLVNAGTLQAVYIGKTYYFVREALLEYKENRKPGRPRG